MTGDPAVVAAVVAGVVALIVVVWLCRPRGARLASRGQRASALRRWDGCAYRPPVSWRRCRGVIEIDHQRPWSRGGRTVDRNLQPLCERHHDPKGTRHNALHVLLFSVPVVGHLTYIARRGRAER